MATNKINFIDAGFFMLGMRPHPERVCTESSLFVLCYQLSVTVISDDFAVLHASCPNLSPFGPYNIPDLE